MGFFKEFKEFAVKGSAMDLAVGVVIGAAFGKVVTSLTSDIIMPPLGLLLGHVDFKDLQWVLQPGHPAIIDQATKAVITPEVPAVAIRFGVFINTIIDFVIVAFSIFIVIKIMNLARENAMLPWHHAQPAAAPPAPGTAGAPADAPPPQEKKA